MNDTCRRFPMATNGWTSPRVPTISIAICCGRIGSISSMIVSLQDSSLGSITPVPFSRERGLIFPGTSISTVPSSFTMKAFFSHLSCNICKQFLIIKNQVTKENFGDINYQISIWIHLKEHQEIQLKAYRMNISILNKLLYHYIKATTATKP